mmetsp:Transcript_2167/g.6168  ORF Transcript_2167/g.6168 Transcript_2167/m.6168 type:complete len:275 (+) Transcript_2167:493-1317(+)
MPSSASLCTDILRDLYAHSTRPASAGQELPRSLRFAMPRRERDCARSKLEWPMCPIHAWPTIMPMARSRSEHTKTKRWTLIRGPRSLLCRSERLGYSCSGTRARMQEMIPTSSTLRYLMARSSFLAHARTRGGRMRFLLSARAWMAILLASPSRCAVSALMPQGWIRTPASPWRSRVAAGTSQQLSGQEMPRGIGERASCTRVSPCFESRRHLVHGGALARTRGAATKFIMASFKPYNKDSVLRWWFVHRERSMLTLPCYRQNMSSHIHRGTQR